MDINIPLNEEESKLNLGGFPPIFFISNESKKKREFAKKYENVNSTKSSSLNILNIKVISLKGGGSVKCIQTAAKFAANPHSAEADTCGAENENLFSFLRHHYSLQQPNAFFVSFG